MDFFKRVEALARQKESLLCVGLDPRVQAASAAEAQRLIIEQNERLIEATLAVAVCYKPNIAFYEAWGEAGHRALLETVRLIGSEVPVLLDAKRNDIGSTAEALAIAVFEEIGADAVTLNPYMGPSSAEPFFAYPEKGFFQLCRTSNPGAEALQALQTETGQPFFLEVGKAAYSWAPERTGLVVAGNDADALRRVREALPSVWLLSPGIGAQGGSMHEAVAAGLRDDGLGILPVVVRSIALADNPKAAARRFTDELNAAREAFSRKGRGAASGSGSLSAAAAPTAAPAVSLSDAATAVAVAPPAAAVPAVSSAEGAAAPDSAADASTEPLRQAVLKGLIEADCFRLGEFTLKSGKRSPFYVDLRRTSASPALMKLIGKAYCSLTDGLAFDLIAGIPVAGLPLATAAALEGGFPMIYPRMTQKDHGSGNRIEGWWKKGDRVLLLDDLITTGKSKIEAIDILREAGLVVEDLVVLLERGAQGRSDMEAAGVRLHAFAPVEALFRRCEELGMIDSRRHAQLLAFTQEN